jgi:putative acetyltransferase
MGVDAPVKPMQPPPLDLDVRAERPEDREAISSVTQAAFGKAREARMVEAIRASDGFVPELSLVAEERGNIIGHVMLSYVELEGVRRRLLELGPMSVLPSRQRQGVGTSR